MKTHVVKTEFLSQILKPSTYFIILIFILLNLYISNMMQNEVLFRIEQHSISELKNLNFPPCLNSFLLMVLLMGSTIFTIVGGLNVRYEFYNKCLLMRATTFGYSNIMYSKVLWGVFLSFCISIFSVIAGFINQVNFNNNYKEYAYIFSLNDIGPLIQKIITLIIVLSLAFTCGMIIGNNIHNTGLTVLICFLLDQFVLAKSWLYSAYVYRQFSDVRLMITVPTVQFENIPSTFIAFLMLIFITTVYLISKKFYRIILD